MLDTRETLRLRTTRTDTRVRLRARRRGITLVEALVSTAITVMTGSAVLLAVGSGVQTSNHVMEETIALGMAQSLVDEVAGTMWCVPGGDPQQWPMGPAADEGPERASYNDIDDFDNYVATPAVDSQDVELGQGDGSGGLRHPAFRCASTMFDNWRQEIDVYYVDSSDFSQRLSSGSTSYHRAVRARIFIRTEDGTYRQAAELTRVFSYIPPP